MTDKVGVSILRLEQQLDPSGHATILRFCVNNNSSHLLWVVDDGWITWHQHGEHIRLSYKREKMKAAVQVFGYFPPQTVTLSPGQQIERETRLAWPLPLSRIWNDMDHASPVPGKYQLSIAVGYGEDASIHKAKAIDSISQVEEYILKWQKEAVSAEVTVTVPQY